MDSSPRQTAAHYWFSWPFLLHFRGHGSRVPCGRQQWRAGQRGRLTLVQEAVACKCLNTESIIRDTLFNLHIVESIFSKFCTWKTIPSSSSHQIFVRHCGSKYLLLNCSSWWSTSTRRLATCLRWRMRCTAWRMETMWHSRRSRAWTRSTTASPSRSLSRVGILIAKILEKAIDTELKWQAFYQLEEEMIEGRWCVVRKK